MALFVRKTIIIIISLPATFSCPPLLSMATTQPTPQPPNPTADSEETPPTTNQQTQEPTDPPTTNGEKEKPTLPNPTDYEITGMGLSASLEPLNC